MATGLPEVAEVEGAGGGRPEAGHDEDHEGDEGGGDEESGPRASAGGILGGRGHQSAMAKRTMQYSALTPSFQVIFLPSSYERPE